MTAQPMRIQRKRHRGERLQSQSPNGLPVVSITKPKWDNPFKVVGHPEGGFMITLKGWALSGAKFDDKGKACIQALSHFRVWVEKSEQGREYAAAVRRELRGKNLACFCPEGWPCHGDVILEILNENVNENQ